jgi:hypothetical protein
MAMATGLPNSIRLSSVVTWLKKRGRPSNSPLPASNVAAIDTRRRRDAEHYHLTTRSPRVASETSCLAKKTNGRTSVPRDDERKLMLWVQRKCKLMSASFSPALCTTSPILVDPRDQLPGSAVTSPRSHLYLPNPLLMIPVTKTNSFTAQCFY